jgi:hypothetical protein
MWICGPIAGFVVRLLEPCYLFPTTEAMNSPMIPNAIGRPSDSDHAMPNA